MKSEVLLRHIGLLLITTLTLMLSLRPTIRSRPRKHLFGWVPKSDKWQGRDGSVPKTGVLRNRPGESAKNFVAQWQSEGDRYVGYENLVKLDTSLTSFTTGRTKAEKIDLLSELTLTYFAR